MIRSTYTAWHPGEPRPQGEPRRYLRPDGYVLLRWKVAPRTYVEAYEHVWVSGEPGMEVHHLNEVRSDNRPENLLTVTPEQHRAIHAARWRSLDEQIVELYRAGLTTTAVGMLAGRDQGTVSRVLARNGAKARPSGAWRRQDVDEEAVIAALRAGERVDAVARRTGIGREVVERVRREAGLPAFPPGSPPSIGLTCAERAAIASRARVLRAGGMTWQQVAGEVGLTPSRARHLVRTTPPVPG